TPANRPDLRGSLRTTLGLGSAAIAASLFAGVAAFGTVSDSPFPPSTRPIEQLLTPQVKVLEQDLSTTFIHEERFQRGDTLSALLDRLGVDDAEVSRLLVDRSVLQPLAGLRPGMAIQARTDADGNVHQLMFVAPRDQVVSIERAGVAPGSGFKVDARPAELVHQAQMKSGQIRSSLFAATDAAGVPDGVAMQLADIFGGDVDFHRDLRRGDRFTVVYEMITHLGRPLRAGRVLAAEFVNQGRVFRAVWFADAGNPAGHGIGAKGAYYTPEGKSLRKAFLRSPLEFSRITSGMAMRFHPILQQWRMHKGIDYGAPTGTRVKSTGDGVVEFVGREGGYGNLVIVRHGGGVTTHYAHLSRFGQGVRRGARVSQGEVIGFVGQTGWATGPHLHYEFRVNDQHRNPLTIAFPAAQPIGADRVASFRNAAEPMAARLDMLRTTNLAALE
ncbi:MAG: M23 family metallopeptidase, partial [Betaproteobacteria bacterium]|nr:M23 family metallopeptidase [Betaproteobacteria bacterium]